MWNGSIFQNKTNFSENGIALQISLMPGSIEANQGPPHPISASPLNLLGPHTSWSLWQPHWTCWWEQEWEALVFVLWRPDENRLDLLGPRSGVYTLHLRAEMALSVQSDSTCRGPSQGDELFSPCGRKTLGLIFCFFASAFTLIHS